MTHLSTPNQKLQQLRQRMESHHIDAYIVPSADPHLSEYLPAHWQAREWLTGFTGSVGTLVVTQEEAGLWVDARYWAQAEKELQDTEIYLKRLTTEPDSHYMPWLTHKLNAHQIVGIDGRVLSLAQFEQLSKTLKAQNIALHTIKDLVDPIWTDRPALPKKPIYAMQEGLNSLSLKEKIAEVCRHLNEHGIDGHFISSLDDIAWLLNCRGHDVEYNPVFLAHLYIANDKTTTLFIDEDKLPQDVRDIFDQERIHIHQYEDSARFLAQLETSKILIDPHKVTLYHAHAIPNNVEVIQETNPSTFLKACKTQSEIEHIKHAMLKDGIALCHFFHWLEQALKNNDVINELTIDEKITFFRAQQDGFTGLSFPTIAGFNENGALPHYRATPESFSHIQGDGLLLIDSGAQYTDGTTDITRVVPIGTPSEEQRKDYTLVLKSNIALSQAVFPEGLAAPLLDSIARQPLWQHQLDYRHGTGHGVGFALNVHEGPQSISYHTPISDKVAMREGMLTSIEPGLYREHQWGIRIENLVANTLVSTEDLGYGTFLKFDTLTLCPINTRCIQHELMTAPEKAWLNQYHEQVLNALSDHLDGEVKAWLIEQTQAI
ncbi:aminopeptidase P family protein [Acinetobacter sp. B5B]|uniref:aminopeptidase P family protein n=1 Tax=Acinetobacter baretiae TaxID=2605383 RepID=UPI0018C1E1A7|nr:aminopeptidase P family protein [Acinetobacter baretiae]MBF7682832.1 aminopeptidase P family protein [Acinetobacter baretiae]MBF7686164.1 aminopeptidase P family protein [Acinetobacter baretiae]